MPSLPNVDDALRWASSGWAVLPLRNGSKLPATAHGVKDATTDPEVIRVWWRQPHNIGARVPTGLVVLDFDPRNGGSVEALEAVAGCVLPLTFTVVSGRGDGGQHHYYLRPPGTLSAVRIPDGIDVKKDTGYCLVPPSIHPESGQPYTWRLHPFAELPAKVVELLHPPKQSRPPGKPLPRLTDAQRLVPLLRAVAEAGEGRRNETLYWAACRAVEDGLPEAALAQLADAARSVGLGDHEITQTLASARRQEVVSQ